MPTNAERGQGDQQRRKEDVMKNKSNVKAGVVIRPAF
jgi:hypothetical protein